jgi:hypothetical protein
MLGADLMEALMTDPTFSKTSTRPASGDPFPLPPVTEGAWDTIRTGHELIFLGNATGGTLSNVPEGTTDVLDWVPATGSYRIWRYYWQ